MKTLLPSGVSMYPVLATRLKVWVPPETVPGVQTMPSLAALAGSAAAGPWASTADPATSTRARTRPSRRVLCRMVAFLPRCSDIGLAHHRLGRQRVLVHPHLGHHSAGRPGGSAGAKAREPAPVTVLEVVDVVVARPSEPDGWPPSYAGASNSTSRASPGPM